MKNKIILHIGYHKTATTFLQTKIFNRSSINYLGIPWVHKDFGRFFCDLKEVNELDFNENYFIERFDNLLNKHEELVYKNNAPLLISLESLHSGCDWFGRDVVSMANKLSSVFPTAKILIGIRNQVAYITSNYAEYLIHGGKMSLKKYLFDSFSYKLSLGKKMQYDKVLKLYYILFGRENVHIYLQEELRDKPCSTIIELFKFLEVEKPKLHNWETVYVGINQIELAFIRVLNKLLAEDFIEQYHLVGKVNLWSQKERFRRKFVRLMQIISSNFNIPFNKKIALTLKQANFVHESFIQSNYNLSILLKRDIEELGYIGGKYKSK